MSISVSFPAVRPTFSFNFLRTESLDSRVTFARNSIATRFNSSGLMEIVPADQPRIDYDPVTKERRGLLIEGARLNRILYSEKFDTVWANARSSDSSNVVISPMGTLTGDKLIEDTTATATHYIYQNNVAVANNTSYTFSVFLKSAERTFAAIELSDGLTGTTGARVGINLTTGELGTPISFGNPSGVSAAVSNAGNGWWRVSISAIVDAANTVTVVDAEIYTATSLLASGYPSYTGDGTSGIYMWGAQLEETLGTLGAFASSYIPTEGTSVQREADDARIDSLSNLINQSEGTWYVEVDAPNKGRTGGQKRLFIAAVSSSSPTATGMSFGRGAQADNVRFTSEINNTTQLGTNGFAVTGVFTTTNIAKVAAAYKQDDYAIAGNGAPASIPGTAPPNSVPSMGSIRLGANPLLGEDGALYGWLKCLMHYPVRFSNSMLTSMTK